MYHVPLAVQCINGVMKEVKMGMGRRGMSFLEDGREGILPGPLYSDDMVFCLLRYAEGEH